MLNIDEVRHAGAVPRFHGGGFIQIYLTETERLHVWHPDFPATIEDGVVHDHNFHMHSTVLLGRLNHVTYDFSECDDGPQSLWQVAAKKDAAQPGVGDKGFLIKTGSYEMMAGSEYHFQAMQLHQIVFNSCSEMTVTRMRKMNTYKDYWPKAVAEGEGPPDNAFPLDAPHNQDVLWSAINEALDQLKTAEN